jgi:hypothetical protein
MIHDGILRYRLESYTDYNIAFNMVCSLWSPGQTGASPAGAAVRRGRRNGSCLSYRSSLCLGFAYMAYEGRMVDLGGQICYAMAL